jgi:hypothetical protein
MDDSPGPDLLFHEIRLEISNPRRIMDPLLLLALLDLNMPKS